MPSSASYLKNIDLFWEDNLPITAIFAIIKRKGKHLPHDTCLTAQDRFKKIMDYYLLKYEEEEK